MIYKSINVWVITTGRPVQEYGGHQEFPWVVVQAFLDQVEWGLGWGPLDIPV